VTARVRPAKLEDADTVFEMLGRFATSYEPRRQAFDPSFAAILLDGRAVLLIADDENGPSGYVLATEVPTLFANAPVIQIEELFVEESRRRGGLGRMLVDGVTAWARERRAAEICVPTRRAGAYYERLGFERTAEYYHRRLPLAE
jgi:GNAT superfamily N-acetyltransferase